MSRAPLAALPLALVALAVGTAGAARPGEPLRRGAAQARVITLRAPVTGRTLLRGGTFTMGSGLEEITLADDLCKTEPAGEECRPDAFSDEYAPHPVMLGDFYLDRTEVTRGAYARCAASGACAPTPLEAGGRRFDRPDLPAVLVTWNEAQAFCRAQGGRLPTEAEWERAARGLAGRRFPWGQVFDLHRLNGGRFGIEPFETKDGFVEVAPVASFLAGATPDGLHDLAGNVEEWVGDWYAPEYPEAAEVNPMGPGVGDEKVVRGGGFAHGRAWVRGASRGHDMPGARRAWRGFRCAYQAP